MPILPHDKLLIIYNTELATQMIIRRERELQAVGRTAGDVKRLGVALMEELSNGSVKRGPCWEPSLGLQGMLAFGQAYLLNGLHAAEHFYVLTEVELTDNTAFVPGV